jgi:hypothetical protein
MVLELFLFSFSDASQLRINEVEISDKAGSCMPN